MDGLIQYIYYNFKMPASSSCNGCAFIHQKLIPRLNGWSVHEQEELPQLNGWRNDEYEEVPAPKLNGWHKTDTQDKTEDGHVIEGYEVGGTV